MSEADRAERALDYLRELTVDMRGGAIIDSQGRVLAASGDARSWGERGQALLSAAEAAGEREADQIHVGTERGEVFVVREGERIVVLVTERFALASLTAFDMRAALRDLDGRGDAETAAERS